MLLFQLSRLHVSWKKHISLDVERSLMFLKRLDIHTVLNASREKSSDLPHLLLKCGWCLPGLSHYTLLEQS